MAEDDYGGAAQCYYLCPNCHTYRLNLDTGICEECGWFDPNAAQDHDFKEEEPDEAP